MTASYKSTPVFDEVTLPDALRNEHRTKAGAWGKLNLLSGQLRYVIVDPPSEQLLSVGEAAIIFPQQLHYVVPIGKMQMRVDFYKECPAI